MQSNLIFSDPWYLLVLCFVVALFLSALLYLRNKKNKEVPGVALKLMCTLRILSITFILFLLLHFFFKQYTNQTQEPLILLAIDNSHSMVAGSDSTYLSSALQKELEAFKKELGSDFRFKTILFGSESKNSEETPSFKEKETDLHQLLLDVENNYSNTNTGAMVLISDGIYNKGANPVYSSEKLGFPIYPIAIGDTTEVTDLAIQKIDHNPFSYLGNIFPAEVVLKAQHINGKEVTVSLFEKGIKKEEKKIRVNSDMFTGTVMFTLQAEPAGVHKYTVKTDLLAEEKNTENNSHSFLVDVIDSRYKILLLANAVHPDLGVVKDALSHNISYELKTAFMNESNEDLGKYNLVIVHGYQATQGNLLTNLRNKNIPYFLIAPQASDNIQYLRFNPAQLKQNDAEPVLNPSFSLFNLSDELKNMLKDLPAVKVPFGNYSTANGTEIMLSQKIGIVETDHPLLVFNENAGLKSAVFTGDGLWKWKMRDYAEKGTNANFNEFLSKIVQYLSIKNDKSLFRVNAPKIINENEEVTLNAEVFNKSYEAITDPEVSLSLVNEQNKQFNYTFSKSEKLYKLNLGRILPGEYSFEAKTTESGSVLMKKGKFTVKEMQAEKADLVADHQVLFKLAEKTGGELFYKNFAGKLAAEIKKNKLIKPITYSSHQTLSLIDLKWFFILLLLFLSAEWYFRKRYLSI